jgi:hypothetical protein
LAARWRASADLGDAHYRAEVLLGEDPFKSRRHAGLVEVEKALDLVTDEQRRCSRNSAPL